MVIHVADAPRRGVVALDTNAVHDYFAEKSDEGPKAVLIREMFDTDRVLLPPAVVTEALSDPRLRPDKADRIRALPLLEIHEGYWQRAGLLRAYVLAQGYRGFLGDVLIAQSCIDNRIPLITYDRDFRRFESAGLQLL